MVAAFLLCIDGLYQKYTGIDFKTINTPEEAKKAASSIGIEIEENLTIWKIADEIFDKKVEEKLIQPVFVTDFPKELSPLSKSRDDDPDYVERFEPYIAGREIGNAFFSWRYRLAGVYYFMDRYPD